jgi:two-component system, sensor histidine kinase and response regulator
VRRRVRSRPARHGVALGGSPTRKQALRSSIAEDANTLEYHVQWNARMSRAAPVAAETAAQAVVELRYGRSVISLDPPVIRVLVVDDNADNRALAQATLEDEDVPVVLAATGQEAIAEFSRAPADCVLLDIRMPGMDGIAVCERIRALPDGDRVAILFLTAQRDVETFDRALRAGGDDFITKPFRPSDLLVRIHTAMRLRRMVSERGLLSLELKEQRDQLQRLQLHKEQLSAFLVHDLKNPVSTIELLAQRLLRNPGDAERSRDAATKIRAETRGLMRMLTNLLDIGKANEGQLAPQRRIIDASELIRAAVEELHAAATAAELELVTQVEATQVHADRDLLHRVLANLIDNAIRHAPAGSAIRVFARTVARGVELRVSDAGPGIPEPLRERVFERFVTGGDGATRTNRGLGLAFCKAAVEAHGGRIWVEDAAPGAVFCIRLDDA